MSPDIPAKISRRRFAIAISIIAAILAAFSAKPAEAAPPPPFLDVPSTHTFYSEINWMATAGITGGYAVPGGYQYRPSEAVLREQMAAFLYRLAGSPAVTLPATTPFTDVPTTHAFYKAIVWMDQEGISTGYGTAPNRTFQPSQPVLREQMAAFLYRFDGSPSYTPPFYSPFSDVANTHTFYKHITWLASRGISTGYSDGTFRPSQPVLREQMAAFLWRLVHL